MMEDAVLPKQDGKPYSKPNHGQHYSDPPPPASSLYTTPPFDCHCLLTSSLEMAARRRRDCASSDIDSATGAAQNIARCITFPPDRERRQYDRCAFVRMMAGDNPARLVIHTEAAGSAASPHHSSYIL
jgi:hypothetical protein